MIICLFPKKYKIGKNTSDRGRLLMNDEYLIPDSTEVCENQYFELDGSLFSCDSYHILKL